MRKYYGFWFCVRHWWCCTFHPPAFTDMDWCPVCKENVNDRIREYWFNRAGK